jgi:hypothetical protein
MALTEDLMGRLVRQGCKGADVRAIQDVLNFHIRRLAPLAVDGGFGPRTMPKLFEEEQLPITLVLVPQQGPTLVGAPRGIQPPRLIPPLTPPVVTPFFLPA